VKKSIIIHPFLFAIYPIFFIYANNYKLIGIDQTIFPIAIILCVTLSLLFFATMFLKSFIKAGILVTAFLILFFSYGHVLEFLQILDRSWDKVIIIGRIRYLLPVWIMTLTVIIYFVQKTDNNPDNVKSRVIRIK